MSSALPNVRNGDPTVHKIYLSIYLKTQCTLSHILAGCQTALVQGRYTWRHNSVLLTLEGWISRHLDSYNSRPFVEDSHPNISKSFIRPGKVRRTRKSSTPQHLLSGARDWVLLVDYTHDMMVFPEFIFVTTQRPDTVICHVILVELTCPAEEGIAPAQERKEARYTPESKH